MNKPILFILFVFCLPVTIKAQQNDITIADVQGNVRIEFGNQRKKAATGQKIGPETWIWMTGNSSISLRQPGMHRTIAQKGSYIIKGSDIIFEKDKGIFDELADFAASLWNQVSPTGTTSSVKGEHYLMLFPADGEVLTSRNVTFRWKKDQRKSYYFILSGKNAGSNRNLCMAEDLKDTAITMSENLICKPSVFDSAGSFGWTIAPSNDFADQSYFLDFSFADKNQIDSIQRTIDSLALSGYHQQEEFYVLMKASLYEKCRMYSEADKTLADAIRVKPHSSFLSEAYEKFLTRISLMNQEK